MKAHTIKYIIKEGFVNTYRNTLMSLASIGTVVISLFVLATFLLITINITQVTDTFRNQPEIEVYCDYNLDTTQVKQVEEVLKKNSNIESYKMITKQDALEKVKEMLGDDKEVLEGIGEDFLPVSFVINLKNPDNGPETVEGLQKVSGIAKVRFDRDELEKVVNIANLIQTGCLVLIIMLALTSMFIVSNTIKLTVFARRKEIGIMKHIGATNGFVRWPFIVEGMIIGLVGALLSFGLVICIYNIAADSIAAWTQFVQPVKISDFALSLGGTLVGVGLLIGALGSALSVRKYLRT